MSRCVEGFVGEYRVLREHLSDADFTNLEQSPFLPFGDNRTPQKLPAESIRDNV